MKVVMLAGGNSKQLFKDEITYKCLAPVAGKPMVRWVCEAFTACPSVDKICVVGPQKELETALEGLDKIIVFEGSDELLDNIESGLKYFEQDKQVMITTADIPMITTDMVSWLAEKFISQPDKQFIYPIIPREKVEERFPGMHRTYVKVKDGEFTGGNICCANPSAVLENYETLDKMIKFRKRPDKTAALLGMKFVIGLLRGKLEINDLEKRVKEIFGMDAAALICPYPEVGSDVDREEDLPSAENDLKK